MAILKIRDENGKIIELPALKGEKGDAGSSGVYVGSGDMPHECNVQVDLDGKVLTLEDIVESVVLKTDQTFNPESKNPQSGKAVAEAVTEKWELLHDIVVEKETNVLKYDVYAKKVYLEAVLRKPENYTSGSVSIYFQPGSYRGAMMQAAYQSNTGLMAVQGDMHIAPSGRITTMLGVEQGEYGYSAAPRRSVVSQNIASNGKISKVQLQATAFGVGSIIKVWGVK